ncbi:glycosyltransferase [Clostridium sp. CAG:265]|uniref:glycosyltransferase n=2 Tax=Clostridium TaxID=1485 RepID=UPI000336A76B|nr:glycosyltransferase [Clostridium sp. CAG:265]CDB75077.1 glycosyl transferase family 2 [Clostridium sp. CAG:265]
MNPEISIIVPVYNVEKYLKRCIDSILNQSFTDFELILVDDGSTDNSGEIIDEYAIKDERIKVIHKENGGLSSARNVGIEYSKGNYIAFVDSDDYINKNMYKILYKNAIKYNAEISICNFEYVYENDDVDEEQDIISEKISVNNNIESLEKLYSSENIQFIVAWNKLYKKNLFEKIRYDYGKYHEDEFIIHKLLYKCNKSVYCYDKLYYYLQRNGSIMGSSFNVNKLDVLDAMKERMDFFREIHLKELEYKTQNNYLYYFFDYYFRTKYELNNNDMLRYMKKQFKGILKYLLSNPNYNLKAKLLWSLFAINPILYQLINNIRNKYRVNNIDYI